MNPFRFFNENLGRRLVKPSNGPPHMDAWRALSSRYPPREKGKKPVRLVSGWAIVRPGGASMQQKLAVEGID